MDFSLLWIQIWLLLFCKRSFETPNFSWHLIHAMKSVLKPRMFPGSTPRSLTFPPWAVDQPALVARGVLCVCIVRAYILYIYICICMYIYIYLIYIFCPMLVLCFGKKTPVSVASSSTLLFGRVVDLLHARTDGARGPDKISEMPKNKNDHQN